MSRCVPRMQIRVLGVGALLAERELQLLACLALDRALAEKMGGLGWLALGFAFVGGGGGGHDLLDLVASDLRKMQHRRVDAVATAASQNHENRSTQPEARGSSPLGSATPPGGYSAGYTFTPTSSSLDARTEPVMIELMNKPTPV